MMSRNVAAGCVALLGFIGCSEPGPTAVPGGDPVRGAEALRQYACHSCHVIPGIVGANTAVGPRLDHIGEIRYLAGVLPATPENLIRWIRFPQQIDPLTAMPDLGVTEAHARDMTAYLYAVNR